VHIAFRTDASVIIGTGHLSRCLTLAGSLRSQGWQTRFVSRDMATAFAEQIRAQGHELSILQTAPGTTPNTDGLAHSPWLAVPQATDAADTVDALPPGPWDWVVVDHYALDRRWEAPLRNIAAGIFVIDDLADRQHDCDVLLDQNLTDARNDRYAGLTPPGCIKLIGVPYALLRPEFSDAVQPQPEDHSIRRLNVFFGGTDPQGGTDLALRAVGLLNTKNIAIDVIVGGSNARLTDIREICRDLPSVDLHVQTSNIAGLFARADLAIGAGGATSWERCRTGLPTLVTSMADNQRRACEALAEARVAIDLGEMDRLTPAALASLIDRVLARPLLLAAMSRRAAALVDGGGTRRVVQHIVNRHSA
jgi:UDP-2,4-diacetamido-2,4,6-trideoxy-beta-L-altropyranose hydrolase